MLSQEEQQQYHRHLILDEIGLEGQEKLKAAKVLVIGAGGLGCPALQYLTAAGVGTIGVIDHDKVELSNLHRQILYTHQDIGKSKAEVASERLSALNPYVNFEVYVEKLSRENAIDLFRAYDVVVDGSDNFSTRYLSNDAAVLAGRPLVFASIFKFEGQLSVFNYQSGPTYRCLYPSAPSPQEAPNCSEIGVLGLLPGMMGCLQANEVVKIVCELGEVLSGKLLVYDLLLMRQHLLTIERTEGASVRQLAPDYDAFCEVSERSLALEISLEELQAHPSHYNLLDVRDPWEREQSHIGGQHIPLSELATRSDEVSTEKALLIYCKTGMRSQRAVDILKAQGLTAPLFSLRGGIQ